MNISVVTTYKIPEYNYLRSDKEGISFANVEYSPLVMNMDKGSDKKPKVINTLKYYREKLGVTQKEIEFRTGVGNRHWPYYENGTHEPKVSLAQRMVAAFNDIATEKGIELKRLTVDDLYPPQ